MEIQSLLCCLEKAGAAPEVQDGDLGYTLMRL